MSDTSVLTLTGVSLEMPDIRQIDLTLTFNQNVTSGSRFSTGFTPHGGDPALVSQAGPGTASGNQLVFTYTTASDIVELPDLLDFNPAGGVVAATGGDELAAFTNLAIPF